MSEITIGGMDFDSHIAGMNVVYSPSRQCWELWMVGKRDGKLLSIKSVEVEEVDFGAYPNRSPIMFDQDNAQALMDCLWNGGIRPSQRDESEGRSEAQGKHIDHLWTLLDRLVKP